MDAPRDDLVRGYQPGLQMRAEADGAPPTLFGHFSVFDTWTEIHSYQEGEFLERVAPGAFAKTIKEGRANIKVLYDHGQDPELGNKPLGPLTDLREDDTGGYYEVPLIDTSYNRDFLIPALNAGLLGASFRFSVVRDEWNDQPTRSAFNPSGLPERTLKEVRLYELGPVTFGAYPEATAKVRSLTDHYHDLRTPRHRAAQDGHPVADGAANSSTPDTPASAPPDGMTPGERARVLRQITLPKEH
jgi:HK97 family phage prohead protease